MPYVNGQRTYTNPMNDPNSSRYWNRGGQGAPSFPGAGQAGPAYGITDGRGFGGGQQSKVLGTMPADALARMQWMSNGGGSAFDLYSMMAKNGGGQGYLGQPLQGRAIGNISGQLPQASPYSGYMGQLGNPMGVTGWQSGVQPGMYPQVDPQEQARRKMLQQQQPQQAYGNPFSLSGPIGGIPQMPGLQQYSGGGVQGPAYQPGQYTQPQQSVTQPFQTTPPWQQRVPQNFNQGSAYGPFVRGW